MIIIKEFKEFAIRGNVMDMAVGVVIGAAFGKIVSSLVDNIITPPIGYLLGGNSLENLKYSLNETTTINYGVFLQSIIDFIIIAFVIFLLVKFINKMKKPVEETVEIEMPQQEKLLQEIRDILKEKK